MSDSLSSVNCPSCGQHVDWSTLSPWRPFCSKRCQLIDFGDWAMEDKRIPGSREFDSEDWDETLSPDD